MTDAMSTTSGRTAHFGRAALLMDPAVLRAALEAEWPRRAAEPKWDYIYGAQWLWNEYCRRHLAAHGEAFAPDTDPDWDRPPPPPDGLTPEQISPPEGEQIFYWGPWAFNDQDTPREGPPLRVEPISDEECRRMAAQRRPEQLPCPLDRELFASTFDDMRSRADPNDASSRQEFWSEYGRRHLEKHGTPFAPDPHPWHRWPKPLRRPLFT